MAAAQPCKAVHNVDSLQCQKKICDIQESLESTTKPKGRRKTITSLLRNTKYSSRSGCEDFLDILEGVDRANIGTVIERIRILHHPSLGEMDKSKLRVCIVITRYFGPRLTLHTRSHFRPPGSHILYLGRASTRHYSSRCDPVSFCRAQ